LSTIKNLDGVWRSKDVMVLTALNLTLVPSVLIFDFSRISWRTNYFMMRNKPSKPLKKAFDEQDFYYSFSN
jgi:hypothetical protein